MKTAMIWGASGGIGRALLHTLQDDGWKVLVIARHADGLEDLAERVLAAHRDGHRGVLDL